MKKLLVAAFLIFSSVSVSASVAVFDNYEKLAKKIVFDLEKGSSTRADFALLVALGYQIMDLYVLKYPECRAQYAAVKADDSAMSQMSFELLSDKYHDGIGLVEAPEHCYQGRSMVVHPHMAVALIREAKAGALDEIDEVARRAPKLKTRLGF